MTIFRNTITDYFPKPKPKSYLLELDLACANLAHLFVTPQAGLVQLVRGQQAPLATPADPFRHPVEHLPGAEWSANLQQDPVQTFALVVHHGAEDRFQTLHLPLFSGSAVG